MTEPAKLAILALLEEGLLRGKSLGEISNELFSLLQSERAKGMRDADMIWLNRNPGHTDGEVSWMVQNEADKLSARAQEENPK